jgi:hypothetical protein
MGYNDYKHEQTGEDTGYIMAVDMEITDKIHVKPDSFPTCNIEQRNPL